jgi:GUN4-like/ARM-like repeat domain, GUN4-N terminal
MTPSIPAPLGNAPTHDPIPASISPLVGQLTSQLQTGSDKSRQQAIGKLLAIGPEGQPAGQQAVLDFLGQQTLSQQTLGQQTLGQRPSGPTWLMGYAYRELWKLADEAITAQLDSLFPMGLVPIVSDLGLDYGEIQLLLLQEDYEEADRQTFAKMCELAGPTAAKRKWFYFSEVPQFPVADLQTLDRLWEVYSEGKFGFTVQRSVWLGVNQVWEDLWPKIGWKQGLTWTRYPGAFTWDLTAPRGHLPLTNQLRGVRAMDALMNHPAFVQG